MGSSPAVSTRAAATVRPWHRLAVRLAAVFVAVTLFTVGVVGVLVHHRQSREIEDTVGTQLLNIARVSGLLVDPALHAEAAARRRADALGNRRITEILHTIQTETLLTTPMRTLTDFDRATRRARIVVTTADGERPGASFIVGPEAADAVAWTFEDGVARYTGIYRTPAGPRISAFAPIPGEGGRTAAVLEVDYPVDFYFDRLRELDGTIMQGMAAGALLAVALAVIVARRLTRPVIALTGDEAVRRRLSLVWGIAAVRIDWRESPEALLTQFREPVRASGLLSPGARVVVTAGWPSGSLGTTNLVHVAEV